MIHPIEAESRLLATCAYYTHYLIVQQYILNKFNVWYATAQGQCGLACSLKY